MEMRLGRWGQRAGTVWPIVIFATITYGALASSAFEWPADPFSVVGTTGDLTAAVFNVGLGVGGVLAVAFAAWLWHHHGRAVAVLQGLVGLAFAGAGLFPGGQTLHAVFGTAVMVGVLLVLVAAAVVAWRREDRAGVALALVLAAATLAVWLPYDIGMEGLQLGYAVAELVTFGSAGLWSVWTVWRFGWEGTEPDREGRGSPG